MKRYKVYVYNTVDKFWDCYEVLAEDPVDACKFLIIRGVLQVSVFEVNLKRSEVTESHDHSEGFFQCKAYTHDGDIAVSDRVPVRTYDFQNLVRGYKL